MTTNPIKTILVVENEPDLQEMIGVLLSELDVAVAVADDGEQALTYLRDHEVPALILLDFQMPNMDGFEFRGRQLKDERLRSVPVIFMTALEHIPSQRDELARTICLKKPFDRAELVSAVRQYMA
jgi:twitching motility two-component system response regulator PilG